MYVFAIIETWVTEEVVVGIVEVEVVVILVPVVLMAIAVGWYFGLEVYGWFNCLNPVGNLSKNHRFVCEQPL